MKNILNISFVLIILSNFCIASVIKDGDIYKNVEYRTTIESKHSVSTKETKRSTKDKSFKNKDRKNILPKKEKIIHYIDYTDEESCG